MRRLWIGGSSGLTRTYMNAHVNGASSEDEDWILLGRDPTAPHWMPPNSQYYSCDLTDCKAASPELLEKLHNVRQVIVSIRPPLFSSLTSAQMGVYCHRLVQGLDAFLQSLLATNKQLWSILHISSVAAANHLQAQHMESSDRRRVASRDLEAPYDRFKRACEEVIERLTSVRTTTNLRLSAIFSDDPGCIQCQALEIQSRIGSYLPQCIDCNSSRNVAAAIRLILVKQEQKQQMASYYYYTRPARYAQPIPYGQYLDDYRRAYEMWFYIWIPVWMVRAFVEAVHWITSWLRLPYLESVDYLLQVSYREHSFDCSDFVQDFPEIVNQEETIESCFRRRKLFLTQFNENLNLHCDCVG